MKKLILIICFALLLCFFAVDSWAATYYVSADGNDGANCASWANRCATISRITAIDGPGDKILFREGDTFAIAAKWILPGANMTLNACDSSGNEITGESSSKPAIDGESTFPSFSTSSPRSMIFSAYSGTTIKNIEFENGHQGFDYLDKTSCPNNPPSCWDEDADEYDYDDYGGHAIRLGTGSDDATVQYCIIHDMWTGGISVGTITGLLIDNNELYHNNLYYQNTEQASPYITYGWDPNISAWASTSSTISNNYIHSTFGEGINLGSNCTASGNIVSDTSSGALYINGRSNSTISGNLVLHTNETFYRKHDLSYHKGIGVNVESGGDFTLSANNKVFNNIVINAANGIKLSCDEGGEEHYGTSIIGNTLIDNDENFTITGADYVSKTGEDPLIIRNNIFYCEDADCDLGSLSNGTVDEQTFSDNLWYNSADGSDYTNMTSELKSGSDRTGDPLFARSVYVDLPITAIGDILIPSYVTPAAGGDGVDQGYTAGSPYNVDYSGTTRPVDLYDIGAIEYAGAPPAATAPFSGMLPQGCIFN